MADEKEAKAAEKTKEVVDKIDGANYAKWMKGASEGDAGAVIDLTLAIGGLLGVFIPEVGLSVTCLTQLKGFIDALLSLSDTDATMDGDQKFLCLLDRGFSSHALSKAMGSLKRLTQEIQVSFDTLMEYKESDMELLKKQYDEGQILYAMNQVKKNNNLDYNMSDVEDYLKSTDKKKSTFPSWLQRHIQAVYVKYTQTKHDIDRDISVIVDNLKKQQKYGATKEERKDFSVLDDIVTEIPSLVKLIQFKDAVFNTVGAIVGDHTDTTVLRTGTEIKRLCQISTNDWIQELRFIVEPTLPNKWFVSWFYNYCFGRNDQGAQEVIDYLVLRSKGTPNPFDYVPPPTGTTVILYPNYWLENICYVRQRGGHSDRAIYCSYNRNETDNSGFLCHWKIKTLECGVFTISDYLEKGKWRKGKIYTAGNAWSLGGTKHYPDLVVYKSDEFEKDDNTVHRLIIFAVRENNDTLYMISKVGSPEKFVYMSSYVTNSGLFFEKNDLGSESGKSYFTIKAP